VKIENANVEANFAAFLKKIKIAVYADAYLFSQNTSFFPRSSGYMFCVDCIPADLPLIKSLQIEAKLIEKGLKKSTIYSYARRHSIDVKKYIFGHFLADYCCQVVIHYLKNRHNLGGLRKEIINRIGINKYFQHFFLDGDIFQYYQNSLNGI